MKKKAFSSVSPKTMVYAGFWAKTMALVTDILFVGVTWGYAFIDIRSHRYSSSMLLLEIGLSFLFLLLLPWSQSRNLQTPGMEAAKIRIRTEEGTIISFPRALGRMAASILSALPLFLGYFWALKSPKKQTWHDILAGTVIVKER